MVLRSGEPYDPLGAMEHDREYDTSKLPATVQQVDRSRVSLESGERSGNNQEFLADRAPHTGGCVDELWRCEGTGTLPCGRAQHSMLCMCEGVLHSQPEARSHTSRVAFESNALHTHSITGEMHAQVAAGGLHRNRT